MLLNSGHQSTGGNSGIVKKFWMRCLAVIVQIYNSFKTICILIFLYNAPIINRTMHVALKSPTDGQRDTLLVNNS